MTLRYAARSDVGMLAAGNADSAYAGAHLLAVADGTAGRRRTGKGMEADDLWSRERDLVGEFAGAAVISELGALDKDLPATELLAALEHTVKTANDNLHRIVESDPALQGMGTTLTAMLWAGNQVALAHIGDSRAYLLRDGELFQITHDHTLVQSLVDEGRISWDEAASHPQRSVLLRALDGRGEVDPDLQLREAKVGDRYLLCSDGLSSVVTAEPLWQTLTNVDDPEQAVRQLIDLANRGGGPDNITCVVAHVVKGVPTGGPMKVGAAAAGLSQPALWDGGPSQPSMTRDMEEATARSPAPVGELLTAQDPRQVAGYRILRRLGEGGMGRVYLARSRGGRRVALKVVLPHLAETPGFRARFDREVRAARLVSGGFTAPVLDADPDADPPWLATSYVSGPSLREAVRRHGPLPLLTLETLAAGLAEAVAAVHSAGLVHRDLKPSNILLAADGPRVIDFGIVRNAVGDTTGLTRTGAMIGTPQYMSPEQFRGEPVGPATDVFSLGAVLVFAATGSPPFGSGDAATLGYRIVHTEPDLTRIPESLRSLVRACLHKEAHRRPLPDRLLEDLGDQILDYEDSWLPAVLRT
ncbi:bifunctional protein-serine/threonine kinase/phosphatase [Actinomadura luteofluorescens]|uniref:bifunctional protein-serine/threonine kinase/phosphatase n=1 Tax=Actinomadura luteofluorescens TaxID=46163 RepID=UPI00347DC331